MPEEKNEPTKEQLEALDEIARLGQEMQPDQYAAVSSSSSSAAAKTPKTKTKSAKKKTTKKKNKSADKSPTIEPAKSFEFFKGDEKPTDKWLTKQQTNADVSKLGVVDFFYVFNSLSTEDQRILFLRKAKSDPVLMTLLNINFKPETFKMFVPTPKEVESCRPSTLPWGLVPYTLRNQIRRVKLLVNKELPEHKATQLFCEFMESLHPAEAKILHCVATGTLQDIVPELSPKLVKKSFGESRFPDL